MLTINIAHQFTRIIIREYAVFPFLCSISWCNFAALKITEQTCTQITSKLKFEHDKNHFISALILRTLLNDSTNTTLISTFIIFQ
jgi:hypothetical protein